MAKEWSHQLYRHWENLWPLGKFYLTENLIKLGIFHFFILMRISYFLCFYLSENLIKGRISFFNPVVFLRIWPSWEFPTFYVYASLRIWSNWEFPTFYLCAFLRIWSSWEFLFIFLGKSLTTGKVIRLRIFLFFIWEYILMIHLLLKDNTIIRPKTED